MKRFVTAALIHRVPGKEEFPDMRTPDSAGTTKSSAVTAAA
jgi:hypothetical protein